MSVERARELLDILGRLPRVRLGVLPTPIEECPRLSKQINGPRIFVKRDDLTGLAFGGNKVRHLEYHLGHALEKEANVVITGSGPQSNHLRQTAAAAVKLGMKAVLLIRGRPQKLVGNMLLYKLLGADYRFYDVEDMAHLSAKMYEVADEYAAKGYKPYVIDTGDGSPAAGAVAYAGCLAELCIQLAQIGVEPQHLAVCSCGGTLAGLLVGARFLQLPWNIFGISPSGDRASARRRVSQRAREMSDILGLGFTFTEDDVTVYDDYVGSGHGDLTSECRNAIYMAAMSEALILDPLYTGRAMAGIIDLTRKGVLQPGETLVFIHTGGLPALFAYGDAILESADSPIGGI